MIKGLILKCPIKRLQHAIRKHRSLVFVSRLDYDIIFVCCNYALFERVNEDLLRLLLSTRNYCVIALMLDKT